MRPPFFPQTRVSQTIALCYNEAGDRARVSWEGVDGWWTDWMAVEDAKAIRDKMSSFSYRLIELEVRLDQIEYQLRSVTDEAFGGA